MTEVKEYEVAGVKFSLSERDGIALTKFLTQMSEVPDLSTMIVTDEQGRIVHFEPRDVSWGFIFFIQNLMIMQRLQFIDEFVDKQGLLDG